MARGLLLVLLVALAACLAGCGGNDESGTVDEEASPTAAEVTAVRETIDAGVKEIEPSDCKRLYTQGFLERVAAFERNDALQLCEEKAEYRHGGYPREVTVSRVRIEDDEATADAAFEGGDLRDQAIRFALVREQGRWKIDRMVEFVEYDRAKLIEGLRREMRELEKAGLEPEVGACLVEGFEGLGDDDLRNLSLFNDLDPGQEIAEGCEEELGALDL